MGKERISSVSKLAEFISSRKNTHARERTNKARKEQINEARKEQITSPGNHLSKAILNCKRWLRAVLLMVKV
jgi:hypothetical protein